MSKVSPYIIDKCLDQVLVKFKQNHIITNVQEIELCGKIWLTIFEKVLTPEEYYLNYTTKTKLDYKYKLKILRDANDNNAKSIVTTRIAVNQALKNTKVNYSILET